MRVWYAAYGSNVSTARLTCYLEGGRPEGARRSHPGARDPRPPADSRGCWLDGSVFFAGHSTSWGGGVAFYDPDTPGPAAGRAWLVTDGQLSDIWAQETGRTPGTDLDLAPVVQRGRLVLGPGGYETLLRVGEIDAIPMLTFTSGGAAANVEPAPPSAAYLAAIGTGLSQAHGMSPAEAGRYLAGLTGCAGVWPPEDIARLL